MSRFGNHARRIGVSALAVFVLAPAAAAIAEPAVTPPAPASLLTAPPAFTWVNPANEAMISVAVSTRPDLRADGSLASTTGGAYLSAANDAATSATGTRVLAAGTYYWQTWWKTLSPYKSQYGAVNTFAIPGYVKSMRGTIQQYRSIPAVNVSGQYVTNFAANKVLCQIYRGKKVISKEVETRSFNTIAGVNKFYCSDLKVSERLDGVKLRLKVTFLTGVKARAVAWKTFKAG